MNFLDHRATAVALCLVAALASMSTARAADPQSYAVTLAATGHPALDAALNGSSLLLSLRLVAPAGPFALVARAQGDQGRLETALHSFGYYAGHARITIDGHPLSDPALPNTLAARRAGRDAPIAVSFDLGPLFHLRRVAIIGGVPQAARAKLDLAPGAPAVASDVLAARGRLLNALLEGGYALARVDQPVALEDPNAHVLDVSYQASAGPRVDLGAIAIEGLKDVHESFVRRRLLVHSGEPFSPSKIEAAREDLASIGVFGTVQARAAQRLDAEGHIPLAFDVTERARHAVSFTASYATDLGGSLGATFTHRNLFGNAEQLNLTAAVTQLGGDVTHSFGYNAGAQLIQPDWLRRDQSLQWDLNAVKEDLTAYSRRAFIAGATVSRKLSREITVSIGLQGTQERVQQEGVSRDYTLLAVPLGVKFDTTDSLLSPTRGVRAGLTATPTESFSSAGTRFVLLQASASTYINLGETGRSIIALRGLVGSAQGASTFQLPPDQRFYAGGSGTVRGFRYESVGPRFADNTPIGGTSVDAGSIEFRQRIGTNYGAAVFIDAGQVGTSSAPFQGAVRVGAGVGARYYTSFGPIRLDVAMPVNRQRGDDTFELYIGLGESF